MSITIEQAKEIIKILRDRQEPNTFTSHEFIGRYIKEYESDYIDMLVEYKNNKTPEIFKELNSQIAKFLSNNQHKLSILENGEVKDLNVHHINTDCKEWLILKR
jgi:hypothetical protein